MNTAANNITTTVATATSLQTHRLRATVRYGIYSDYSDTIGRGLSLMSLAVALLLFGTPAPQLAASPAQGALEPQQAVGPLLFDAHEVSVGTVRRFAQATGFVSRAEREGGGYIYESGWTKKPGWTWKAPFGRAAQDNEPAVHLMFDEAQAVCRHFGKRLPTDAEWTGAAYLEQRPRPAGGFQTGQRYPFPNGTSARQSHCLEGCGRYFGQAPSGSLTRGVGHVPVATTPAGVNGLHDMGGNVWEWVDTGSGQDRITRGASWWYGPERQREDDVATKPMDTRVAYIGFRCVQEKR